MTTHIFEAPAHVPPECVWDHDFAQFLAEGDNPFLAASRLHEGPGAIWARVGAHSLPAWIFTSHELIAEGFADDGKFSSQRGANAAVMDSEWLLLPVEADRPDHRYYRQALNPFFTPSAIRQRTSAVQELCDTLIDGFAERGSCEFIDDFAVIMPNAIVISLLGMPREMLGQFLDWEHKIIHGETAEECLGAGKAVVDYLKRFIAEQRRAPDSEVMAGILAGQMKDRSMNDAEILGIVYLLFVAGLDTVYSTLGWIMHHLAGDQALQDRLRDNPGEIPAAVDEFTRAFGVSAPSRIVAHDIVFHGVPMKQGEAVLLPTFLAGRDPRQWRDPHTIDIARRPRHVTFGLGPHVCLGVHLAKREMQIMIETCLKRMRAIRRPSEGRFAYHTNNTLGVDLLDLEWDRP